MAESDLGIVPYSPLEDRLSVAGDDGKASSMCPARALSERSRYVRLLPLVETFAATTPAVMLLRRRSSFASAGNAARSSAWSSPWSPAPGRLSSATWPAALHVTPRQDEQAELEVAGDHVVSGDAPQRPPPPPAGGADDDAADKVDFHRRRDSASPCWMIVELEHGGAGSSRSRKEMRRGMMDFDACVRDRRAISGTSCSWDYSLQ
uniref:Uncharacterized protein n=1 Tax=Oryza meridionalis TaxID=40149 RepID=A0A0E0EJP3_9ORYZ